MVVGNWKMYAGPEPRALAAALDDVDGVEVAVAPPFTGLAACVEARLVTYAQNVHWAAEGAFTGEVSAPLLLALGVRGAIVGHSERRQYFGETEEEREAGETEDVLRHQLAVLAPHDRLVIAYEPRWAIGTGRTATPEVAQDAHAFVKSMLARPVLYGGSVTPENADELLVQPDVDGVLVGGASLDVERFASICRSGARIRS